LTLFKPAANSSTIILLYISGMKPVIQVTETQLLDNESLRLQLQTLGKQIASKGLIEFQPKTRKATEVIRILRENGILYQIRFEAT
jgi:hypothetical protein